MEYKSENKKYCSNCKKLVKRESNKKYSLTHVIVRKPFGGFFECKQCGKICETWKYLAKTKQFCSKSCFAKNIFKKMDRSKMRHWKDNPVTRDKMIKILNENRKKRVLPRGENHPNWKGGVTNIQKIIRNSIKYKDWRLDIFGRDNYTCQECGKIGGYLEAHHKIPFYKIIKKNNIKNLKEAYNCNELWNIDNGITYCIKCHSNKDNLRKRTMKR